MPLSVLNIEYKNFIYIWPIITKHNWTLYAHPSYIYVLKKSLVINVYKLHIIFSYASNTYRYIFQIKIFSFFYVSLKLGINIGNLTFHMNCAMSKYCRTPDIETKDLSHSHPNLNLSQFRAYCLFHRNSSTASKNNWNRRLMLEIN